MTCGEFQSLILPFINGKLGIRKKEEFIEHILSCKECKEELEIYYIIINCVKELDDDEKFTDDYDKSYREFIENTRKGIKSYKNRAIRRRATFMMVVGAVVGFTGVTVNTEEMTKKEEVIKSKNFTDNDLDMRFRLSDNHIFFEKRFDLESISIMPEFEGEELHEK